MADHTLIPPVSGNHSIPKSRRLPPSKDRDKRSPPQQKPEKPSNKKDDDRPSIDEYA